MSIKTAFILGLLLVFAASVTLENVTPSVDSQYIPIPKRYPGLFIGSPTAAINIELIYDPSCTPLLMQVMAALNLITPSETSLLVSIRLL